VEAFARSLSPVFFWAVPFAVLSLLLVVAIPELPLRDTAHIGTVGPAAVPEASGQALP
jgi:hypothetical protein